MTRAGPRASDPARLLAIVMLIGLGVALARGVLIPGAFEGVKSKIVLTAIAVSALAGFSLAGTSCLQTDRRRLIGWSTIVLAVIAFGTALLAIWSVAESDGAEPAFVASAIVATVAAMLAGQASLGAAPPRRSEHPLVLIGKLLTQALIVLGFANVLFFLLFGHR